MTDTVQVIYARKPCNWHEIETGSRKGYGGQPYKTEIIETREMTEAEYNEFIADPLASRDWLAGKGGFKDIETRLAIAITSPGRRILYVDPSGSDYGRYIGMDISIPFYLDVQVKLTGANGNAFNLLGLCRRAAQKAGVAETEIKAFVSEATAGNYDHLLATCQRWFDCY
jgi:hypothetical protein